MTNFKISAAVSVDKGLIRNNNEDNFYFNGKYLSEENRDDSQTLTAASSSAVQMYGVFDGMGGEARGEEASFISAQVLRKYHKKVVTKELEFDDAVFSAVEEANKRICKRIIESGERRIGATFSALVVEQDRATVFNIGDSRVYRLKNGQLTQVSIEDTSSQRLVDLGVITPEEALTHKDRHKLTQHLGIFPDELMIETHKSQEFQIEIGDKFLLCSDGLTDMLTDSEIEAILSQDKSSKEISEELVKMALKNGGHDNVTVLVLTAEEGVASTATPIAASNAKLYVILGIVAAIIVGVLCWLFLFNGSGGNSGTNSSNVQEEALVQFVEPPLLLEVGDEGSYLTSTKNPADANRVKFESSDSEILEIHSTLGMYKALKPGKVIVSVILGDERQEVEVTVSTPVTDISGLPETLTLKVGKKYQLEPKIVPEDAKADIEFTVDDSEVVGIDKAGSLFAKKSGTAVVSVIAGKYTKNITITVEDDNTENKEDKKTKEPESKKPDSKKEDPKKEDPKKEDPKKEDSKKEDSKKDESNKDGSESGQNSGSDKEDKSSET